METYRERWRGTMRSLLELSASDAEDMRRVNNRSGAIKDSCMMTVIVARGRATVYIRAGR